MSEPTKPADEKRDLLAPVAAISTALKDASKKVPIAPVSVGVGIGSAALMAALLYAGRKRSAREKR